MIARKLRILPHKAGDHWSPLQGLRKALYHRATASHRVFVGIRSKTLIIDRPQTAYLTAQGGRPLVAPTRLAKSPIPSCHGFAPLLRRGDHRSPENYASCHTKRATTGRPYKACEKSYTIVPRLRTLSLQELSANPCAISPTASHLCSVGIRSKTLITDRPKTTRLAASQRDRGETVLSVCKGAKF